MYLSALKLHSMIICPCLLTLSNKIHTIIFYIKKMYLEKVDKGIHAADAYAKLGNKTCSSVNVRGITIYIQNSNKFTLHTYQL